MVMRPAGILLGEQPTNRLSFTLVVGVYPPNGQFKPNMQNSLVKIGSFRPTAFMQLLAKIGYSFAAAETGTAELLAQLADIILGRSDKSPYLIGGGIPTIDGFQNNHEEMDYLYKLQMHEIDTGDHHFTLVSIHLFGQLGLPQYHVVVRQRPKDQ